MSALASKDVLRPGATGAKAALGAWAFSKYPLVFRALRRLWPIPHYKRTYAVTLYDDVREVYLSDDRFGVPYRDKLDVIMGGEPFFLGMDDPKAHDADVRAMRDVVLAPDIPNRLAPHVESAAEAIVATGNGKLEVVDQLVRRVTFDVYSDYLGVPTPDGYDLKVWATRLFEFQFADFGNDPDLRKEVDEIAPALRAHIDGEIAARKQSGRTVDDVLGRCLALQPARPDEFSDVKIRTALMGFMVGGPPQPPMVVPQALEQLLLRPTELERAQLAARANDHAALAGVVFEAMRFDPLAPALPRVALGDQVIAKGTRRATDVPNGATVHVAFSSAMRDSRRVPAPETFDPARPANAFIHFGLGRHMCFGARMNEALLPLMLKPLLRRKNLRHAPGGRLVKRGAFSDRLNVLFD
ncbi:cytochrome P450 [Methylopila sp. M107]|uniref:cytochrome P450 n=1 Tax=Methylopila sp. M107 TaxID=1101190 RepID=UPI00039B72C8|nr:cytochrome P450 [Methylopila sp. M107]